MLGSTSPLVYPALVSNLQRNEQFATGKYSTVQAIATQILGTEKYICVKWPFLLIVLYVVISVFLNFIFPQDITNFQNLASNHNKNRYMLW